MDCSIGGPGSGKNKGDLIVCELSKADLSNNCKRHDTILSSFWTERKKNHKDELSTRCITIIYIAMQNDYIVLHSVMTRNESIFQDKNKAASGT